MARIIDVLPEELLAQEAGAIYDVIPELALAAESRAQVFDVFVEVLVALPDGGGGGGLQGGDDLQGNVDLQGARLQGDAVQGS